MMKPLRYVVLIALCAPALGCRVSKQDVELLERDLRIQEDEIYSLQDCVDTYQKKLEACRAENRALRKELADKGDALGTPSLRGGPSFELPGADLPSSGFPRELDPGARDEAPPFNPPRISPPGAEVPAEEIPPLRPLPGATDPASGALRSTGNSTQVAHHAPRRTATGRQAATGQRAQQMIDRMAESIDPVERVADPVHDLAVTEMTLNKMLTGGMNRDHRDGDEGILVVIEPRNAKNEIVQAYGQISIVLLDPALEGEAARIARWDITSQELEHKFRARRLGRGFQLELPWPGDPPQNSDLHLFVRFVTDDGRKLVVDRDLKIVPPGRGNESEQPTAGWVPATRSTGPVGGPDIPLPPGAKIISETDEAVGAKPRPAISEPTLAEPEVETSPFVERQVVQGRAVPRTQDNARAQDGAETRSLPTRQATAVESTPRETVERTASATAEPPAGAKKRRPEWKPYR